MYTWSGMRKLNADEIFWRLDHGRFDGLFLLYDDNTEAVLDGDYDINDVLRHLQLGGEIGEEIE